MASNERMARTSERLGNGLGDGNGLSWTCGACMVVGAQEPVIVEKDRQIIRELAKRVAHIAAKEEQEVKKSLWLRHNALQETRPLIFCDPENAWYEIIPSDKLKCEGNLARIWEFKLRKEICWSEKIKDDRVIESNFRVQYVYENSSRGLDVKIIGGENDGAHCWEAPLKDYNDLERMAFRRIVVNHGKTQQLFNLAKEVLGDILEVNLEGSWWWSHGMTTDVIHLRGFEQMLVDLYDDQDGLCRLMAFLRDENLARLDFLEQNGLLSLNNGGDFIGTGGYGWSSELPSAGFDAKKVRTSDLWGFCESQETIGVSPDMFEKFIFPFQLPILERFGLNIYGCCEPLDKRWNVIKRIPRLRKVTVSPWSNVDIMAEKIGKDYIYCRKVNPSFISTLQMDEENVRKELRDTFKATARNNCRVQVLMRDIVTLSGQPENAIRWTQIAREEAENVYKQ